MQMTIEKINWRLLRINGHVIFIISIFLYRSGRVGRSQCQSSPYLNVSLVRLIYVRRRISPSVGPARAACRRKLCTILNLIFTQGDIKMAIIHHWTGTRGGVTRRIPFQFNSFRRRFYLRSARRPFPPEKAHSKQCAPHIINYTHSNKSSSCFGCSDTTELAPPGSIDARAPPTTCYIVNASQLIYCLVFDL